MLEKLRKWKSLLKRWSNRIYPRPADFDAHQLERREKLKPDYRILADSLARHLSFQSMLDVGCAQGLLLEPLRQKGIDVQGIEVSDDVTEYLPEPLKPHVTIGDFSEASGSYDLVCCVEVAEHIPPSRSQELVNKLCGLSNQFIYFTAAPLGQKGHGHINCRPHRQWIQWFNQSGYHVNQSVTKKIKSDLEEVEYTDWLEENSFLLDRK